MTGNMEAGGHGVYIDERSIETCAAVLIGRSVPSYLTHAGAASDRLGKEIAVTSGVYREGLKVKARSLQFLDAFGRHDPQTRDKLVELAQNYPDQLGISLVVAFNRAWVLRDGTEVDGELPKPADAVRNIPSIRVTDVRSADLVQKPAANLGLFEAKIDDKTTTIMSADTILLTKHTEEIASLSTQHKDAVSALETKHKGELAILEKKANDSVAALAVAQEDAKKLTATLAAVTSERDEAAKYDMRKAGGEALNVALQSRSEKIPAPANTDSGRWEQYTALCTVQKNEQGIVTGHIETPAAALFKKTHLTRK